MDGWKLLRIGDVETQRRGWLMGHFYPPDDIRNSTNAAVKFGSHKKGEKREKWSAYGLAVSISVLIQGKFTIHFQDGDAALVNPGDHVIMGPNVMHRWTAEEDSIILTIRTPSLDDMKEA